jgi:hypothetical protein
MYICKVLSNSTVTYRGLKLATLAGIRTHDLLFLGRTRFNAARTAQLLVLPIDFAGQQPDAGGQIYVPGINFMKLSFGQKLMKQSNFGQIFIHFY